jgi:hypothetical protein
MGLYFVLWGGIEKNRDVEKNGVNSIFGFPLAEIVK